MTPADSGSTRSRLAQPGQKLLVATLRAAHRLLDRADASQGQPFDGATRFVPHTRSRRYGWTHYGVMIPDLPAPHRFFSIMSIVGTPGALAFDTDHALADTPRRNATVVSGTAATHPRHFGGYSIPRDCEMRDDGSVVRFGNEVCISGGYPQYRVQAGWDDFAIDLQLRNTDRVTWFLRNPVYDHLSLLSHYEGTVTLAGVDTRIAGRCTFEWAACTSPYILRDRPLAPRLKAPVDFFTYQIVNLDDGAQLLLTQYMLLGRPLVTAAYLRSDEQFSRTYPDATFEVLEEQPQPAVAPDGRTMRLPRRFRWRVRDGGSELLDLECGVDTPFTYGLGSGYVGAYAHRGRLRGRAIEGRGYIEYIDRRGG